MHQRSLGATGLKVSRLGLGTMTWGRDTDEHEARDQLIAFAEAGGTLVDTAAGYGDGASEELIGTLIGDVVARDEVVLATKAGIHRRTGARVTDTSRGSLLTTLDASLRRLGVDHVDLWQVHVWTDETPVEETLSALDLAVTSGRASYVGVSNYTGWQTAQAATWQRAVPGRVPLASTQVCTCQRSTWSTPSRRRDASRSARSRPREA
jgi:aryl-alcohol dehydrogenase-like predicted oxidoreductase